MNKILLKKCLLIFRIEEDDKIARDLNRSGLIHQNKNCVVQ